MPYRLLSDFRRRENTKNGSFNFGIFGLIANIFALGKCKRPSLSL
jgi:hypothetical protein